MTKWIKQLTRENTLLDRSLRSVAYSQSLKEIGKASMAHTAVVGHGLITSVYYDPKDYKKQQTTIKREFAGRKIEQMGKAIIKYLEQGYLWASSQKRITPKALPTFLKSIMKHHAHSRGAIVYGYWGEPVITAELKFLLKRKLRSNVDEVLSTLSSPKIVQSKLTILYHPSAKIEAKKQKLLQSLKLDRRGLELVEILSWFTFFYEVGERVSSLLYDTLLWNLKRAVGERKMSELVWYDPPALARYFKGVQLKSSELAKRKLCYVLINSKGKLKVISGHEAKNLIKREFEEKIILQSNFLQGTTASKGKVQGRVKIVITKQDQNKMKKGDILLSTMTTPRLITAVKKAGAIVTDEGGLTAHAAIVSREFGIPCIVGTKYATKVFKDGDLVEVDATSGIVRKLK